VENQVLENKIQTTKEEITYLYDLPQPAPMAQIPLTLKECQLIQKALFTKSFENQDYGSLSNKFNRILESAKTQ